MLRRVIASAFAGTLVLGGLSASAAGPNTSMYLTSSISRRKSGHGIRRPLWRLVLLACSLLAAGPLAAQSPWTFHDESFRALAKADAKLEFIAGGFNGCEGAVWITSPAEPAGYLRFGAVHTNVAFRWDEKNGLRGLRSPSNEASAFQPLSDGGLAVAEQTTRRVVRYETDGRITVLADAYEGKKLNRPNDLVVKRDGSVWFTDPDYLFDRRPQETKELTGQYVFRLVPSTRELRAVITDLKLPNGIAFSPDESLLYVGDSGAGTVGRWPVRTDGTLGPRQAFLAALRVPDGVNCDRAGNVWVATSRAIEVFSAAGKPLADLAVPGKRPASLAFGGPQGGWLFVCTREAVWRLAINPPQ